MTCPDWPAATVWRHGDGAAPDGWQASLDHLAGCVDCRRRVAVLDPALLLVAAAAPAPEVDDADVAELKATVRSLVAADRLGHRGRPDRRGLAAAAALVALLALPLALSRLIDRPAGPPAAEVAALPEPAAAPPVEEVQPAGARVYQLGTDELPVVLIFDENLDL